MAPSNSRVVQPEGRNVVNQGIAFLVFLVLLHYAWSRNLLFKPDPAVPIKGTPPRKEKGESMYFFPTTPAFYASAPDAAALQRVYDTDRDAMQFVRLLHQKYQRFRTAPVAASAKQQPRPVSVDAGSPYGTWGLFLSTMGTKVLVMQPRSRHHEKVTDAVNFGKLNRNVKMMRKLLAERHTPMMWAEEKHSWVKRSLQNTTRKSEVGSGDLASTISYGEAELDPSPFLVHVGVEGKVLPALRAVAEGENRPLVLLVDFRLGDGGSVDIVEEQQLDGSLKEAQVSELQKFGKLLASEGYSLLVLRQPGCPFDHSQMDNHTLLGSVVYSPRTGHLDDLLRDVVYSSYANPAVTVSTLPICRLLWMREEPFQTLEWPLFIIGFAAIKLLCVAYVCLGRRSKRSRSL